MSWSAMMAHNGGIGQVRQRRGRINTVSLLDKVIGEDISKFKSNSEMVDKTGERSIQTMSEIMTT